MIKQTSGAMALCFMVAGASQAQNAGRIGMGSVDLIPVLDTDFLHIDNVAYASDEDAAITSWVGVVSPQIRAVTEISGNEVELGYRLERGEYFSSSADNYTDHYLHADGDFVFSERSKFTARANFVDGHDDRGRVYSNGFGNALAEPDTFRNANIDGTLSYGNVSSTGRIALSGGYEVMNYDDRSEVLEFRDSAFLRFRDREYFRYGAAFYYRVAPSTNLVVDANRQEITYDETQNPLNSLDSDENSILAGLTWQTNDYTRSFAKVGYKQKKFDSVGRDDFSGVAWEVGMAYQPVSYSEVKVETSADTRETNSDADYIRSRDYSVSWKHAWVERFTTTARIAYATDDFEGQAGTQSQDETTKVTLGADYNFRRWLQLGIFYQINERDSNRDTIDYDRDVIGLSAKVTL